MVVLCGLAWYADNSSLAGCLRGISCCDTCGCVRGGGETCGHVFQ